ncbi:hypothetical protein [Glutamicibacter creatinolyticus]|uniref:hypothetical protein n=1 Tax=Glutamicibacter creatinolyticus TaxID=162496 RepID=UPI0031D4D56D
MTHEQDLNELRDQARAYIAANDRLGEIGLGIGGLMIQCPDLGKDWETWFGASDYNHADTVLALLDRVEAAEQALDFHTQRDRELKTLLSMIADRLDEFCYDELASLIEDEPLNQWSEKYTSKLQAAERERDEWRGKYDEAESARTDAEAAVQRVEDVLSKDAFSVQEDGFCADDLVDCDEIRAALKGPTTRQLQEAEAATRELHEEVWTDDPAPGGFICKECRVSVKSEPCDTIRALDGGEQE